MGDAQRNISLVTMTMIIALASFVGIICGYYQWQYAIGLARGVSKVFINILEFISIPMIFLSIVSTISGMESFNEMKTLGKRVLFYTLLTTIIAASIALILFVFIDPAQSIILSDQLAFDVPVGSYLGFLESIIPSNLIMMFGNNAHVTSIVFFSIVLSITILSLEKKQREFLHMFFSSFFFVVLKISTFILTLMPFGIWAFLTLFVNSMSQSNYDFKSVGLYLVCILCANFIQGLIVLPLFLLFKGFSPIKIFQGMSEALITAFFSKSSNATLPLTISCATGNIGVSKRVALFALPLCSTINMNGCAAFIMITVLFVGQSNGIAFSFFDMIMWIFIATIAAVGNAGVPMGCYFISSAFLVSLNVPLYLLGAIFPLYTIIDMIETMLNVWSDSCVTVIVDKDLKKST